MNIYLMPASESGLKGRIFETKKDFYKGGIARMPFWKRLRDVGAEAGITVRTFDEWSRKNSKPDDMLLVQNHPGETFLWRIFYFLKHPRERGGYMLARRRFLRGNHRFFSKR